MKVLFGLCLTAMIFQGVFCMVPHKVVPTKNPRKVPETLEPIQSEEESQESDFLQDESSRAILSKLMRTMLAFAMDEEVNSPILETLNNINSMFKLKDTEQILTWTLGNFNRAVLIPTNLHLVDLLVESGHLLLSGATKRNIPEDVFHLIRQFAEDPIAKDVAAKSARLARRVTSDEHLFASARALVEQMTTLVKKDNLRVVRDLVLAVDKHLTGNTLPPVVSQNGAMSGKAGAKVRQEF